MLNVLGVQVTVTSAVVASEAFALDVVTECIALGPMLLFVAAVLAYPKSMPYKAKGLLEGVSAIMGVNLIRIVSLFILGSIFPYLMEVVHLLVWQSMMGLLAVAVWLIWSQDQFKSGNDGLLQNIFWALADLVVLCLAWLGIAGEYNQAVESTASSLLVGSVSVESVGLHLMIVGAADRAPVVVPGFTKQWGILFLTSIIAVTSAITIRSRVKWIFVTAAIAYVLQSASITVLALVFDYGPPVLRRMAMDIFVSFWALVPILLVGVGCLSFWQNRRLSLFRDLKLNKNICGVSI